MPSLKNLDPDYPYPGLRPFKADEGVKFFGRRNQISELLIRLARSSTVFIVGPSGCGKSSIIRPGLLQALKVGRLPTAVGHWNFVDFKPGKNPLDNLCKDLRSSIPEIANDFDESEVLDYLSRSGGLRELLKKCNQDEKSFTLLLADQFEEILPGQEDNQIPDTSRRYVRALTDLFYDPVPGVFLVFTMRSDFIGDCTAFNQLPDVINTAQYLVKPMEADELRIALSAPAEERGVEVEETLIQQLIDDIQIERNRDYERGFDTLPLVQHVMSRIWLEAVPKNIDPCLQWYEPEVNFKLGVEHYKKVGRLRGALNQHGDEVYNFAASKNMERIRLLRKVTEIVLRRITRKTFEGKYVRNPTNRNILLKLCQEATYTMRLENETGDDSIVESVLSEVLKTLSAEGCSFLAQGKGEKTESYDLVNIGHEALIRQWTVLKEWADDEANAAGWYRNLVSKACIWNESKVWADLLSGSDFLKAGKYTKKEWYGSLWAARYSSTYSLTKTYLFHSFLKQFRDLGFIVGLAILALVIIPYMLLSHSAELTQKNMLAITYNLSKTAQILELGARLTNSPEKHYEIPHFLVGAYSHYIKVVENDSVIYQSERECRYIIDSLSPYGTNKLKYFGEKHPCKVSNQQSHKNYLDEIKANMCEKKGVRSNLQFSKWDRAIGGFTSHVLIPDNCPNLLDGLHAEIFELLYLHLILYDPDKIQGKASQREPYIAKIQGLKEKAIRAKWSNAKDFEIDVELIRSAVILWDVDGFGKLEKKHPKLAKHVKYNSTNFTRFDELFHEVTPDSLLKSEWYEEIIRRLEIIPFANKTLVHQLGKICECGSIFNQTASALKVCDLAISGSETKFLYLYHLKALAHATIGEAQKAINIINEGENTEAYKNQHPEHYSRAAIELSFLKTAIEKKGRKFKINPSVKEQTRNECKNHFNRNGHYSSGTSR